MARVRARIVRIGLALLVLGLVTFGPHLAWRLLPAHVLRVVLVDPPVPFLKYREHAAVPWILHAMRLTERDGRFLDPAKDYVGYHPETKSGDELRKEALAGADALVITDTYGVYVGDYEKPGDVAALERSPKIYGGFSGAEAEVIESFAGNGGLVLAEFNTFASPTDDATRARLEHVFGVRWTHWVARSVPNLQDENEVPRWVGRLYQRVERHQFDIKGGGLVFVLEDKDIVVLKDGVELGPAVVEQLRTKAGAEFEFPERGGFWFWMDLVEPMGGEVLFEHVVDVTPEGAARLAAHGVPRRFPALVKRANAWYFAGDFVDTALELGNPERAGLLTYRKRMLGCGGGGTTDEAFFWGFYVPIVSRLFASRAH